jgi:HPt (histidine-containing phosphotransfer) domain-containing protein
VTGDLERVLRELRATYIAESPQRLAEVEAALSRVEQGEREASAELARLLHRLAGSGGSYGLPAVTSAARAAEALASDIATSVSAPAPDEIRALRESVGEIAGAFDAARRALEAAGG